MSKFKIGDHVRKTKGSQWKGVIVGTYSTTLTPEGYAVESDTEKGSVQIYPASALESCAADPQQEPVMKWESIEAMAAERYKVAPSHDSMFYRHAVVAGDGARQLYIGREIDCQNMATKFAGAFLDGAFVMQSYANQPQRQSLAAVITWLENGCDPKEAAKELRLIAAHGIGGKP